MLLSTGPGLFCVGFTIGTGAVTKLASAGAQTGWQPLWVLPLGAFLFWALMEAGGRYAVITGNTLLYGFRTQLWCGKVGALFILAGVVLGQWTGLPVLVSHVSQLTYDALRVFIPSAPIQNEGAVVAIGVIVLTGVYGLLLVGRLSLLEKTMALGVVLMLLGFLGAWSTIAMTPASAALGSQDSPSAAGDPAMLSVTLLGIAMAAPTLLARALWLNGKGWREDHLKIQKWDAGFGSLVLLLICAAVLACGAGGLHPRGLTVGTISDAMHHMETSGGRAAAALFLLGTLGAGLTSILPMAMIVPLLLGDYRDGNLQIRIPRFRFWSALACLVGLAGPIFGEQLLAIHRAASRVAQVFVLPLALGSIIVLLNCTRSTGGCRAGFCLNAGLLVALAISLFLSWLGLVALKTYF